MSPARARVSAVAARCGVRTVRLAAGSGRSRRLWTPSLFVGFLLGPRPRLL